MALRTNAALQREVSELRREEVRLRAAVDDIAAESVGRQSSEADSLFAQQQQAERAITNMP